MKISLRTTLSSAAFAAIVTVSLGASAAPTKEECLREHSAGQDEREAGRLVEARASFATCSNPACPALVQSDCANYGEQLAQLVPSVSFAARDAQANDLPDTAVYVDDELVAARLDHGHSYELNPGRHRVRFEHAGRTVELRIVINQGEKGRTLIASFGDERRVAPRERRAPKQDLLLKLEKPTRSSAPLWLAATGGVLAVGGGVVAGIGLSRVPDNCSLSTHQCAAAPGDPAFSDARTGVTLANVGIGVGAAGVVLAVSSLIWYLAAEPESPRRSALIDASTGAFAF
jgi:hypothetical protein